MNLSLVSASSLPLEEVVSPVQLDLAAVSVYVCEHVAIYTIIMIGFFDTFRLLIAVKRVVLMQT